MTPPANSKIAVSTDRMGNPLLTLPTQSGFMRYFIGAFLLFWLGGWAMGEFSVMRELVTGHAKAAPFLLFWLGAWTIAAFLPSPCATGP
jgi:hypothetical protein